VRDGVYLDDSIFGSRILTMVRGSWPGDEGQHDLFYMYVQYLLTRRSSAIYPLWYLHGVGAILGLAEIEDSSIRVGYPGDLYLRGVSEGIHGLASIIEGKYLRGWGLTSWAMTYYFLVARPNSARGTQTLDYLRRFNAGEDPVEAFDRSYMTSPSDMSREIEQYMQKLEFVTSVWPRSEYTGSLSRRVFEPGDGIRVP
jgi:hypothetical protein